MLQEDASEKEAADRLPAEWDEVILKSKNVDASLRIVKRKFTQAWQLSCFLQLHWVTVTVSHVISY